MESKKKRCSLPEYYIYRKFALSCILPYCPRNVLKMSSKCPRIVPFMSDINNREQKTRRENLRESINEQKKGGRI